MGAAVAVAVSAGLVVDHGNQTEAVATAQEDAAEAQAARQSIQESLDGQDADLSAARGELSETQESLSRLEGWAEEAVALMRERDPSLTQQEALARIVEELRELRERSADHEDQLTGLKSYGDMARLNPAGLTGTARPGSGLSESSDLSRALEGAWDVDDDNVHAARCDQAALGKFSGVARKHPTFPFAHYALATCALSNEDPEAPALRECFAGIRGRGEQRRCFRARGRAAEEDRGTDGRAGFFSGRARSTPMKVRWAFVQPDQSLSMRRQCEILAVNRSSLYYEGVGADPEELALMRRIDELHLEFPFFGSRRIGQELRDRAEAKHEPA